MINIHRRTATNKEDERFFQFSQESNLVVIVEFSMVNCLPVKVNDPRMSYETYKPILD